MDDGDFYGANCTAAVNLSGTVVGNVQSPSLYSAHSHRSLRTVTEKVYSMRSHVVAAARLGSYASAWTTPIPLGAPNATPGTVLADRRWFVEKVLHLVLSWALRRLASFFWSSWAMLRQPQWLRVVRGQA